MENRTEKLPQKEEEVIIQSYFRPITPDFGGLLAAIAAWVISLAVADIF